jgi:hypothetical protein
MTKTTFPKVKIAIVIFLFVSFSAYSQNCEVDNASLKGTYTGDCKKNKAHGKGKAVGTDTYEGDFKNGLPDGDGTYTWSNSNVFTGKYTKGLKEGKGKMTFKMEGRQDSVVEGYWKKDIYIGEHEKPWEVHAKTGSIRNIDVDYTADKLNRIKVIITNTTGSVTGLGGIVTPMKVDNMLLIKGSFQRQTNLETHLKSTETTFHDVMYPFRIKLQISKEEIEIEFFDPGSYTLNISINN